MANFNTINTYDADVRIPSFSGLLQYGDGINFDPRYATEAKNVDTTGGVLQPAAACTLMTPSMTGPIETLTTLYRRWYSGNDDKTLLIAASGGQLYYMLPTAIAWTLIALPTEWTPDHYSSNVWSCVAYEINPEGSSSPVDVLLLSNSVDGMIMVRGDNLTATAVTTPKKFGVIERYAERIWGGAIADDPDMLVYSAPYDPTDWAADAEIPEDGAGDITQPSWDGDSFTALKAFGSQLIAFKGNRVWRILGTDPGEYTFKEQFGGGAHYPETIAVDKERILFTDREGVLAYDGLTVVPFNQQYADAVWKRINTAYLSKACGCLWKGTYYCALPLDSGTVNNSVIMYDTETGTWLLREDVAVEAFLPTESYLYFTSATTPGRIWKWAVDSWTTGVAATPCKWVTPWNDLQYKQYAKGNFTVIFLAEVKSVAATLTVTLQTERKSKAKAVTISPLTAGEISAGTIFKQKTLSFGGNGRRFRLTIESTGAVPWRIIGGLIVMMEIDPD